MRFGIFAIVATTAVLTATVSAAEKYDPFARPFDDLDLRFADQPLPFDRNGRNAIFKPDGAGPFPALVLMPTCRGDINKAIWALGAIEHGYAVLAVDPLTPRWIGRNCESPPPVPMCRLLKDAFDAAEYLRKQPFVDPARVGLMGFEQGGVVGLAATGSIYSEVGGRKPFRAVASLYPVCVLENDKHAMKTSIVDIYFVPERIVVPILVQMGDRDFESGKPMNGCKAPLDERRAQGAPVEYVIYHAKHMWDLVGDSYVTGQSAKDAFSFLDAQLIGP